MDVLLDGLSEEGRKWKRKQGSDEGRNIIDNNFYCDLPCRDVNFFCKKWRQAVVRQRLCCPLYNWTPGTDNKM